MMKIDEVKASIASYSKAFGIGEVKYVCKGNLSNANNYGIMQMHLCNCCAMRSEAMVLEF